MKEFPSYYKSIIIFKAHQWQLVCYYRKSWVCILLSVKRSKKLYTLINTKGILFPFQGKHSTSLHSSSLHSTSFHSIPPVFIPPVFIPFHQSSFRQFSIPVLHFCVHFFIPVFFFVSTPVWSPTSGESHLSFSNCQLIKVKYLVTQATCPKLQTLQLRLVCNCSTVHALQPRSKTFLADHLWYTVSS